EVAGCVSIFRLLPWPGSSWTLAREQPAIAGVPRANRPCSAEMSDPLALDQIEVDLRADARRFRAAREPVLADRDVAGEPILMRAVRQQYLEIRGVANGTGEVQLRVIVERVAAVVLLVIHVEGFGEMRSLEHGGEAALDRDVAA